MKKIWMVLFGVVLFLSYIPNTQAQLSDAYAGTFSGSVKGTCEGYDNKGDLKLYTDNFSISGSIHFYKFPLDPYNNPCYIKFEFTTEEGLANICITEIALVNTGGLKSKNEKFQIMGYGDFKKFLNGKWEKTGIALIDAKGNATEDQLGNIISIKNFNGKLSGGDYWSHQVNDDNDCIWTATVSSNLSPQ